MYKPSYGDIMEKVNSYSKNDIPIVTSRYSVIIASARRARQLIDEDKPLVQPEINKPISIAVKEIYEGKVRLEPLN